MVKKWSRGDLGPFKQNFRLGFGEIERAASGRPPKVGAAVAAIQIQSNPIPSASRQANQPPRLQDPSRQPPNLRASRHPSLQTCGIGVYHLSLGAAARLLRGTQAARTSVPGINEIYLNPHKSTQIH